MQAKDRSRNTKEVAAGLIDVLFGAGFSLGALDDKLGDAARLGPGWFALPAIRRTREDAFQEA